MNVIGYVVGALSFGDTESRVGNMLRRLYFSVAYNTTFPVNLMLSLGSMTPFLVYLALAHELTVGMLAASVVITFVSAYFYNLLYIINDIFDRSRDERLRIPKQTARHILGNSYLGYLAVAYLSTCVIAGLVWSALLVPLLSYGVALMAMSVVHSNAGRWKVITVFIERWAKFCAPLLLISVATRADVMPFFFGAAIAYPLGFTFDYAYQGYLRDRLGVQSNGRVLLYAAYWLVIAATVTVSLGLKGAAEDMPAVGDYLLVYFLVVTATYALADKLPLRSLDALYSKHVAGEKRRLLAYGLIQLGIILVGAVYVAFT